MSGLRHSASILAVALFVLIAIPAGAQTPAFPGAEGFGRFATGGRGGDVYHVTTLEDSGPGSFRDAVSKPNRIVVFDVGGVIRIRSRISVAPNITIAGQTAPGPGITVYGNGLSFSGANNSITRHIRFRMGVGGDSGKDAITIAHGHDMIFDHVSVAWGRDENFSISGPVTNVTIQNCIIAQGLQPHSCGGLIQTDGGVSILRTLYIDNHTRNPKVKGVNQFVNNVVYNWGGGGGYILGDSAGASFANVIGNYFINGPSTSVSAFSRGNLNFRIYAEGNFQDSNRNGALDGRALKRKEFGTVNWQETPYPYPSVSAVDASVAVKLAARRAGAWLHRDSADLRLIEELLSYGTRGATIRSEEELSISPETASEVAPPDRDRDGMPDFWEEALGLDAANPADARAPLSDGRTRLEEYLDWLAEPHRVATAGESFEIHLAMNPGFDGAEGATIVRTVGCRVESQSGLSFRVICEKPGIGGFEYMLSDEPGFTNRVNLLVRPN
ncbi:MAG TPA: pectate lyase [Verrucomicrobia bacterium]|nr:pectate lyase [Verrucomicrobiota bacterium]HOP97618.1 pectate lyase [Verrucomicrobiota bacterium]